MSAQRIRHAAEIIAELVAFMAMLAVIVAALSLAQP